MNAAARNIRKTFDLSSLSSFTFEDVARLDVLVRDGRANVLNEKTDQPGGLGYYSLLGVRYFDQEAEVAVGGLIGGKDRETVKLVTSQLAAHDHLIPVSGKTTNRSLVFLGPDDHRFIVRRCRQISFEHDLQRTHQRKFKGMMSRSRACVLGNIPTELTQQLIEFGKKVGTYVTLVAGFGDSAICRPIFIWQSHIDSITITKR